MNSSHSFVTEGTPKVREAEVKRPHRSLRPHYAKIIDFSGRDRRAVGPRLSCRLHPSDVDDTGVVRVARADIKKLCGGDGRMDA